MQPLRMRGEPAEAAERARLDGLTGTVIGCAIRVHRELGPGLLESVYEACLGAELTAAGLEWKSQVPLPVRYRDLRVETAYRLDLVVESKVLVEIKAVEGLQRVHRAQTVTYLKLSGLPIALLINFNTMILTHGICRIIRSPK